eukprot:1138164-Pelagomonas_calceolata.AAC.3
MMWHRFQSAGETLCLAEAVQLAAGLALLASPFFKLKGLDRCQCPTSSTYKQHKGLASLSEAFASLCNNSQNKMPADQACACCACVICARLLDALGLAARIRGVFIGYSVIGYEHCFLLARQFNV